MSERQNMKKKMVVIVIAALIASIAYGAQDTALTQKEVRDPRQLETWLENNASDAETRLAAVEGGGVPGAVGGALASGKIVVGNSVGTGEARTVSGDLRISNTGVASLPAAAVELTNCSSAVQSSLGKADTAIQSGATFNAAAAAYDVSGFTNGTINANRIPNLNASKINAGDLALARISAGLPAYDVSGFTNGVLGTARGGAGSANGILKANGSGTVSAATAGTDYIVPSVIPRFDAASLITVTSNAYVVATITKKNIILKSNGENFTVVLPNATAQNQEIRLKCASTATTNSIVIPDSGNVECGNDWTGGVNDVIEFWSEDGTNWVCTGTQDND